MHARIQPVGPCPSCAAIVTTVDVFVFRTCGHCGESISISRWYELLHAVLAALMIGFLAALTYTPLRSGTWILALVVSWPFALLLTSYGVKPWLTARKQNKLPPFWPFVLGMTFVVYIESFVGFGWLGVLVGWSGQDKQQHFEMLSYPLAWWSTQFLITTSRSFLDLCGVIVGNSVFYAAPVYVSYCAVSRALRRNRTIQLGLTSGPADNQEERETSVPGLTPPDPPL